MNGDNGLVLDGIFYRAIYKEPMNILEYLGMIDHLTINRGDISDIGLPREDRPDIYNSNKY